MVVVIRQLREDFAAEPIDLPAIVRELDGGMPAPRMDDNIIALKEADTLLD